MKLKLLVIMLTVSLLGCKDDDPKPTAAERQGVLLAGKKGESKTWILTDYRIEGAVVSSFDCLENNEYTFTNNNAQEFFGDEGDFRCSDSDTGQLLPQGIESGNWAFSIDGEIVIISSSSYDSPTSIFSYFSGLGNPFPADVITLTATQFIIETEYSTPSFIETARLTFTAVD